jgi:hypothetical protein
VTSFTLAEHVLTELGITEPHEIDLEAIAWHLGARVKYCLLDGCEAQIVGYRGRAVIRVDSGKIPRRRRFSLAHELGHWRHHRDRMLVCRSEDIGDNREGAPYIERVADAYAADLLLPHYLFRPIVQQYKRLTAQTVRELADLFDTSLTATAIRLIESKHSPVVLVCHGPDGRKWFRRSPDVPERWFPRTDLDPDSFAFDLLFGSGPGEARPCLIGADAWFDRHEADRYELHEHSIRIADDEILTLLLIEDGAMLTDWGSRSSCRR